MAERRGLRVRLLDDGRVEIVDPDPGTLELIQALDPGFRTREALLPGFSAPRLLATRTRAGGLPLTELPARSLDDLWRAHDATRADDHSLLPGEASLLDLKAEIARRLLVSCDLCAHRCHVDRTRGERGRCGLGTAVSVYEAYVHIAEEPPINPAFNVSLRGCGLRCRYCQQGEALSPCAPPDEALAPSLWPEIERSGARSLVFIGGNPTESLPGVLDFLRAAPAGLRLPIGWNCGGFDAVHAIRLLDGVCDVYVPDFKYGDDGCAAALSGAPGYVANATSVVQEMCRQDVPVYVRLLVLPGHRDCCHLPSLERLAFLRARIRLNVMAQYAPDFLVRPEDGPLARRPTAAELRAVRSAAARMGFQPV